MRSERGGDRVVVEERDFRRGHRGEPGLVGKELREGDALLAALGELGALAVDFEEEASADDVEPFVLPVVEVQRRTLLWGVMFSNAEKAPPLSKFVTLQGAIWGGDFGCVGEAVAAWWNGVWRGGWERWGEGPREGREGGKGQCGD